MSYFVLPINVFNYLKISFSGFITSVREERA